MVNSLAASFSQAGNPMPVAKYHKASGEQPICSDGVEETHQLQAVVGLCSQWDGSTYIAVESALQRSLGGSGLGRGPKSASITEGMQLFAYI